MDTENCDTATASILNLGKCLPGGHPRASAVVKIGINAPDLKGVSVSTWHGLLSGILTTNSVVTAATK